MIKVIKVIKDNTLSRHVTISNKCGLHARPAAKIAKLAQQAEKIVWISAGSNRAEASSIIDLLTIGGCQGSQLLVTVEIKKDIPILDSITELIENGFGEELNE